VFADLGFANAELELAKARMVQTIADEIERRGGTADDDRPGLLTVAA
jgi:hypothetical protein